MECGIGAGCDVKRVSKLLIGINSRTMSGSRHQWLGHEPQVHANPRVLQQKPAHTIGISDYSFPSDPASVYSLCDALGNSTVSTAIGPPPPRVEC